MKKKRLARFLCLVLLLNICLPIASYADSNKIQDLEAYNGDIFDKELLLNNSTISEIEDYLTNDLKSELFSKNDAYALNPYVYQKYKVIAYTNQEAIDKGLAGLTSKGTPKKETQTKNIKGKSETIPINEYRYLGYKVDGSTIITNDFYPADSKTVSNATSRNYVFTDPDKESWSIEVLKNPEMLYYYLKTPVLNDDKESGVFEQKDYTIAEMIKEYDTNKATKFPTIMSDATFSTTGTLMLAHLVRGSKWYDTVRVEQFKYKPVTIIEDVKKDVKLPVGTESYDISYSIATKIEDIVTDTVSKEGRYISSIELDGDYEKVIYENKINDNIDLPSLKETGIKKTVDLRGFRAGVREKVEINVTSIVKTFDRGVKTSNDAVSVYITLVANDTIDFTIKRNETDVTDGTATVDNLANPNLTLTLNDTSFIESGDVSSRVWKYDTPTGEVTITGGNEESVDFTITGSNKDCIIDDKITFIEYVYTANGLVGSVKHFVNVVEKTTPSGGSGVVAVLTSDADFNEKKDYYEVMEGERFTLRGNKSYHEAGLKLTEYAFDVGEEFDEGIIYRSSKKNVGAFYPDSDGGSVYKAYLDVTAEDGSTGDDKIRTKVYPAKFDPEIEVYGSFKENRKLSFFVDNTHKLTYYPIDESSLIWTVTPLDGQGDVVRVDGSLSGSQSFDALFKKKGRYKVSVTGEIESDYNTKRYTGSTERIINIAEDLPPEADLVVEERKPRDIENGLMTKLYLYDNSNSPDGDIIVQRIMSYKFDSDNDGDFDDETSVIFHAGNEKEFYILTDHVGNYQFDVKVKEEFGQETISRFITDADKKRGDTSNKDSTEKTTELYNVAPTVELEVSQKKKVNLIVYEDLDFSEKTKLKTMLTDIETGLIEKKIDLDTHYLSPTETVGNREIWTTYFDSYISVNLHVEGEGEDEDDDWDIDETITLNFLLDSFTSEGSESDMVNNNIGRFEFVDVEWGNTHYEKYKYKNRSKDYKIFQYRELILTYLDNGEEKTTKYNFTYDYTRYDDYGSGPYRRDEFTYDTYEIVSAKLIEDEPSVDRERFVVQNNTFSYSSSYRPTMNLPSYTKRSVSLKKYSDLELETILSQCENEDTFFLNVASKEENRLALDKKLLEHLTFKNITYLTLDDYKLRVNPLTGRFDELYQGDRVGRDWVGHWNYYEYYINRMIVKIGNLAYEIDEENNRYMFMGLADRYEDMYGESFKNLYMDTPNGSAYTNGYERKDRYGRLRMYYGMEALEKLSWDKDEVDRGVESMWDNFLIYAQEQGYLNSSLYIRFPREGVPESWYRDYLYMYDCEPDGSIVGLKLKFDLDNKEFEYEPKRVAYGGYIGMIKGISLKTSKGYTTKGYVHENGNIYFKDMYNFSGDYGVYDYMTVTEGIGNIEQMEFDINNNTLYVYTIDKVVKYDFSLRTRTVIASDYIERRGTSVKIGENKWMIGDIIYDGYKEIYTNDITGTDAKARYTHKSRTYYAPATSKYKYYIDLDDNLYEDHYWYCKKGSDIYEHDEHKLIATDVSSIPFMRYLSQFPKPDTLDGGYATSYSGNRWGNSSTAEYKVYSHYMKADGYIYTQDGYKKYFSPIKNVESAGVGSRRNSYGNYLTIWPFLIGLEDGTFGFTSNFSSIKPVEYANLTVGSTGDVVGDNKLIASTEHSKALNNFDETRDYILDIYVDYTTSDTMTILLNDLVNTSMVMFDREDDPAYEGGMVINTEHVNPNYYENSLGKDPSAGKGIRLDQFKYVGHYLMEARVRDNPVGDDDRFDNYRLWNKDNTQVNVYVHRRPVAKMDYVLSEKDDHYILRAWDKDSYDLDHESESNNGIVAWQWSIKEKDETSWIQYQTKEIAYDKIKSGTTYDVIFKVKDKEGVWSEPVRKEINPEIIPIELDASVRTVDDRFRVDQLPITEYYEVYDMVTRYPTPVNLSYGLYDGDTLLTPLETLTQDEGVTGYFKTEEDRKLGQFTWYNRTLKVPKTLADGAYTIGIKATAINNASKSETCILDVGVRTPIHPVPSVEDLWMTGESYELSCRTSIYTDEVVVSVFNGSPKEKTLTMTLDEIVSEEIGGQIKQTEKLWKATCAVPEDLVDGMYNVVFTGRVLTTPSKSEQAIASVQVISLKFDEVILSGAWNHWRGQIDLFGKRMDDMPLRFLSWEKVYFTAKTLGNPEKVYIRLSPELEAMSFTDKNGTKFNYKDDFGYEVEFPLALKEIEDNVWTGEYILPLAHSTLSWEDRRLKPAYEIIVTAEKNGKRVTYEFTEKEDRGIEITGNVTNLIYEQPMPDRSR